MKEDHRSNGRNCQIVNDILEKMAKAFWKWHIGRKWQKWRTIAKFLTKIQMRWQRGPFESGDFGENGSNGEQSPNYMKEDHRSNGRNFCSCEKKAEKIQACTRFQPLTTAIPMQRSTNSANKQTGSRSMNCFVKLLTEHQTTWQRGPFIWKWWFWRNGRNGDSSPNC